MELKGFRFLVVISIVLNIWNQLISTCDANGIVGVFDFLLFAILNLDTQQTKYLSTISISATEVKYCDYMQLSQTKSLQPVSRIGNIP